jgi:uncharacterized protein (DUF305 family)
VPRLPGYSSVSPIRISRELSHPSEDREKVLHASEGDAFDATFITQMSKHHENGIKMASTALSKAQHPEVKEMAKKIIASQKEEIDLMSHWKKGWKLGQK